MSEGPFSEIAARARLEYETRSESLRQARADLRDDGLLTAASRMAERFAANNRTGISILSGRISLGLIRPPS